MPDVTLPSRPRDDRHRATLMWDVVQHEVKGTAEAQEFRQRVVDLPPRILRSGLLQTLAFAHARDGWPKQLRRQLARAAADVDDLGQAIRQLAGGTEANLAARTAETLRRLEWLKRFARAELPE